MKKFAFQIFAVALTLVLVFSLVPQRAEAAGIDLSGAGSLRPGESVTLTCSASGSNIYAMQASLHYDTDKLALLGTSCLLASSWSMDMHGRSIVLSDSQMDNPINGSQSVFSVTFQVKDSVSSGDTVSASVENVTASDGESDISLGTAGWSAKIGTPPSGNAALSSLSCGNAALSPSFSADTTSYSTTVPYDVTSLSLDYQPDDADADITVSGNSLSVGDNTITVKVTAADGSTRRYTVSATRKEENTHEEENTPQREDPPEKKETAALGTDATLAKLTTSSGRLSPAFSPKITSYVVYVPYEVSEITLKGEAHDDKALGVSAESAELEEGDNELFVRCIAEDGKTVKDYQVHVWRMPLYEGTLPKIIPPNAKLTKMAAPAQTKTLTTAPEVPAEEKSGVLPTLWSALCAGITVPFLSGCTGEIPLYILAAAVLLLLLLFLYILGTRVGKRGRREILYHIAEGYADSFHEPEAVPAPKVPAAPKVAAASVPEVPAEKDFSGEPPRPREDSISELGGMSLNDLLNDIRNM